MWGMGLVQNEDVLQFSGGDFSKALVGSDIGIPHEVDFNAITVNHDSSNYVFSLDSAVELGGALFDDSDLVEFDGSSFTMFFDGSDEDLAPETYINAAAILSGVTRARDYWTMFN